MVFSKGDLVELFVALGYTAAQNWGADKIEDRAKMVATTDFNVLPFPLSLTKDTERTLFALRAAVEAEKAGWGDPIAVAPNAVAPKRKRRRKMLYAHPVIRISNRGGRALFDWLKKFGYVPPNKDWRKMGHAEREEAVAFATVELIEEFADLEEDN